MTSKGDNLKTNEFLRLRKLRLQQVREQSKDIAKKIRQRAKVEQLRHISNVDPNKEKVYFQRQEQLVSRLEELYFKGLTNVGVGHRNATEVNQEDIQGKKDLSKLRGKEAAAELKKIKQAKLDAQKKILDRKLQARDAANELSREKSLAVVNTLRKPSSNKSINKASDQNCAKPTKSSENSEETQKEKSDVVTKNDMGTQWESEEMPNEWGEPNIPTLSIPKDDNLDNVDKSDKNKRLNLFALSDEMPSSLRGGVTGITDDAVPDKPSLTLVSNYLQNRGLRLRQPDTAISRKNSSDDLQNIKHTLLRTRASRADGTVCPKICHVLDEQVIPVPCWRAERKCEFCPHKNLSLLKTCSFKSNYISFNNPLTVQSGLHNISLSFDCSKPYTRTPHGKYHRRHKIPVSGTLNNVERSSKIENVLSKKNSVTVYDHNTRHSRDLLRDVENFVVRDQSVDDDAYSEALKESEIVGASDQSYHKAQQERRNRIAVTKHNVEKEYRDTLAFLNSIPKEKPTKSVKMAYMDGARQQEIKDNRQRRLQQEYKKIEKECSKHRCKHAKCKTTTQDQSRSKSKSPRVDNHNKSIDRNFQYSWMPVPESDDSLAIHTIPNTVEDKPGNTVKFSSVDTYHEYRSRHRHTPPTKDVNNEQHKRVVEAVIIQENSNDSMGSSYDTDTSSVDNLQVRLDNATSSRAHKGNKLSNAEKIIIYKVTESKKNKKHKAKKIVRPVQRESNDVNIANIDVNLNDLVNKDDTVTFNQVKEGVYRSVSTNGDNIPSMFFSDDPQERRSNQDDINCEKLPNAIGINPIKPDGCDSSNGILKACGNCKSQSINRHDKQPSPTTSASSFRTAFNEKANRVDPDGGYIKFVDDGGQDAGKFYVGASGFLKDDAYEVVIQLRKKEAEKNILQPQDKDAVEKDTLSNGITDSNYLDKQSTTVEPTNILINSSKSLAEGTLPKTRSKESITSLHTDIDKTVLQKNVIEHENKPSTPTESNTNLQQNKSTAESPKNTCDKNTCTSFRDSFAIQDNAPTLNAIPKPLTSTYTQTQRSPIPRPVLMHLSSSTSTTYMSLPDIILPRYLGKDSLEIVDHKYEQIMSNVDSKKSRHKECKGNRCNKCNRQHADTPPNSTRSTDQTTDIFDNRKKHYNSQYACKHKKSKSHKCKVRSESKTSSKQKFKRCFNENKRIYTGSRYSTSSNKQNKTNNLANANLNPVVENYVKKLLALNKEGLKAIEVVNQECSDVTTPSSSIIDVPSNVKKNKPMVNNKISLEQIKNALKEQILKNIEQNEVSKCNMKNTGSQTDKQLQTSYKSHRKRPVHKIKSLNISKQLIRKNKEHRRQSTQSTLITTSPLSVDSRSENNSSSHVHSSNERSECGNKKTSTSRRMKSDKDITNNSSNSDTNKNYKRTPQRRARKTVTNINAVTRNYQNKAKNIPDKPGRPELFKFPFHISSNIGQSSESEVSNVILNNRKLSTPPISISTQTKQVDSEVELMKMAENKLQNMEKIADLTEKCTKRLSNLAKVLEEVRKNKSLAYSQISTSDTASDSDQRSDKNVLANDIRINTFNAVGIQTFTKLDPLSPMPISPVEQKNKDVNNSLYASILKDIPKPDSFKTPSPVSFTADSDDVYNFAQQSYVKSRGKPPPALKRNLKHVPEGFVIPHELSTVVEVDSPMSVKHKSNTSRLVNKNDDLNIESIDCNIINEKNDIDGKTENENPLLPHDNSNIIFTKCNMSNGKSQTQSKEPSDVSKMKMMDLKQFNDIMLKPFISLHDYAKQYDLDEPEDASSRIVVSKDEPINEELSSLHSEVSLPDVMAELLKRNLISEPFKFETTSNVNSSTGSSESTISMLALSKVRKEKKKSGMVLKNKENIGETSQSFSLSSNPDLENAFQKLGMGWASSTLKKTKERLALSSSSNTSSSSMPHFKMKSFNYQDIPELSKDSVTSLLNISNKRETTNIQDGNKSEPAKNALQQTSLTNYMTVKEFLANELAKKITFSNKSNKNVTDDEFISLCETKMPEEMKHLSHKGEETEKSLNSPTNVTNNRARTSTPVQIFKSMTYHSTSSSNTSNGLFSNVDELSSVKVTSNSNKNQSTSDKDDLTIPNYSLKMRKGLSDCSKSD